MAILLSTVFIASLLGSLHCVGMCGPFALLASTDKQNRNAAVVPTLAYSFGRLITYSIVGLIFGALGLALNQGTSFSSWQRSATYVAGGLMIVVGAIALARHFGAKIRLPSAFRPLTKIVQAGFAKTKGMQPVPRALMIGALTSLMPCGWLYTFAITAAGTGSPLWGMILMITFWAGTVPIMTALMLGFNRIGKRVQQKLPVIMASLVVLLGMFTIVYRAPVVIGAEANQVVSDVSELADQIEDVDQSELPCCQDE